MAFGSLVWLPVLFRARAEDQGYSAGTAILVGSVFATLFQLGGGAVDPRRPGRRPAATAYPPGPGPGRGGGRARGRAVLPGPVLRPDAHRRAGRRRHRRGGPGGAGQRGAPSRRWAAAWPPRSSRCADLGELAELVRHDRRREPAASTAAPSTASATWSTASAGPAATRWSGWRSGGWPAAFPPPLNYAVGLAAFQLFFIPTGIMYWLASRTVARTWPTRTPPCWPRASASVRRSGPDGHVGGDPAVGVERLAAQQDPGAGR